MFGQRNFVINITKLNKSTQSFTQRMRLRGYTTLGTSGQMFRPLLLIDKVASEKYEGGHQLN